MSTAKTVEIGIVGMGRIGHVHLGNISARLPFVHVRYVCDLLIEKDQEMRSFVLERVPATCKLVTDYHEVVADPAVQAVMCLASTNNHVEICLAAIAAGKHVFCEKPVAMEVKDTVAIMKAAEEKHVLFQVGFNRRFDHNFRHIRETVASGKLGKPTIVHVISRDPTYDIGYIKRSIEEGGMFVDMTIHDFDMVQYMLGDEDPIVEVMAYGGVLCAPEIGALGDVDTAVLILRSKNGVLATIDNTRKAVYGYDQRVEVLCTNGCMQCDNDRPTTCRTMLGEGMTEEDRIHWWFRERYPEAFIAELREFYTLVMNGGKGVPPVGCRDMLRAMNVAFSANESLKTGLPAKVPQI